MADAQPPAAAGDAAVSPNALAIAASDDAAACIKCRYCKVVLRQDNEVVSCDLCASVSCGKCWGQRGRKCSNSGGRGGTPCHADGAYDPWEFKIGEILEMDLAHGFVRAARGEEDRAFCWLQLQFKAIRHGIAMELAATTDDELRRRRADEIQIMINGLGTVKGKAKRMGDGIHRAVSDGS